MEQQYLELLLEEDPTQRTKTYPTLEEAIENHNREFNLNDEEKS